MKKKMVAVLLAAGLVISLAACGGTSETGNTADVKTGNVVFKGSYEVAANGRKEIASLPQRQGQGIFKISYTGRAGERLENHYLYGNAPFDLKEYRSLLKKTKMFEVR